MGPLFDLFIRYELPDRRFDIFARGDGADDDSRRREVSDDG